MVRFAEERDLEQVNRLREQVNALHAAGRPDLFKSGFCRELRDLAGEMLRDENRDILVAERDGALCGMACVEYLRWPESAYMRERNVYHIAEFCVDEAFRRRGVGRELLAFMGRDARRRGFSRIELDAWSFNEDALKFYESAGFETFRRFLEWNLEEEP